MSGAPACGCRQRRPGALDRTAEQLALGIAVEPEGSRGALTEQVRVDGHRTDVTVSQTTTDVTGGVRFHDLPNTDVLSILEGVGTAILDAATVAFPAVAPLAFAAGGVNAAEAGQQFAGGDPLGGVLDLGAAAGAGLGGLSATGGGLGLTAREARLASQYAFEGTALMGGVSGTVQSAESGDGLGIAAGLLQASAAASAGIATYQGSASNDFNPPYSSGRVMLLAGVA